MCSHPCTNTQKIILLIDTNVLIYTKVVFSYKREEIENFWENLCSKHCCVCEERQFHEEFWEKERDEEVKTFFNNLREQNLIHLQPYKPLLKLPKDWKDVIDLLKRAKQNDEKGLARLVKLAKTLIETGCPIELFEIFTYDKAFKYLKKINLRVSNEISHQLWRITKLPPNWPEIFKKG